MSVMAGGAILYIRVGLANDPSGRAISGVGIGLNGGGVDKAEV